MPNQEDPLTQMFEAGLFEPFIRYIRFPHFKNLRDGTRVNFDYPITALVGPNGTNKTAILRALQGCPDYENLGQYWFSTNLDPISPEERHRFIHGYRLGSTGETVEVIKTRIARQANPDYFEPSRPLVQDGMTRLPDIKPGETPPPERARTRWRAIQKRVTYIDFRSELSAYDKYFFHVPFNGRVTTLSEKKDFIRRRSRPLKTSLDGRDSHTYYRSERIIQESRTLNPTQTRMISQILGRQYDSIKVIAHRYFDVDGYSVLLKASNLQYSEAFAGSGEFATVMLVREVTEAPECSLILLDEPEVSLHPGAQSNLMTFIRDQARIGRHQFVISTHAPETVRNLPASAIKVFLFNPTDGKVELASENADPSEAFYRLGVPISDVRSIYVEDSLAAAIIRHAIRPLGDGFYQQIKIEPLPGGAGTIQTQLIPALALTNSNGFVFLDGDQQKPRPAESGTISDGELDTLATSLLGGKPRLPLSGGSAGHSEEEKNSQLRTIVEWVRNHVSYLPGTNPETFLLIASGEGDESMTARDAKLLWDSKTRQSLGRQPWEPLTAAEILGEQERALARLSLDRDDLVAIREQAMRFVNGEQG